MTESRQWILLAETTLNFISAARENGFCLDLLPELERRLYDESPFSMHDKKEESS